MTDATGNVLRPPGYSRTATTTDDEILASYSRLNQKGVTLLQTASTVLEAGTVLKVSATPKKYAAAAKIDTAPIGILRKQVDVSSEDMLANVVFGGVIKGSKVKYSDDADGLTTAELQTLAGQLGGRYDVVHDQLIY